MLIFLNNFQREHAFRQRECGQRSGGERGERGRGRVGGPLAQQPQPGRRAARRVLPKPARARARAPRPVITYTNTLSRTIILQPAVT